MGWHPGSMVLFLHPEVKAAERSQTVQAPPLSGYLRGSESLQCPTLLPAFVGALSLGAHGAGAQSLGRSFLLCTGLLGPLKPVSLSPGRCPDVGTQLGLHLGCTGKR